MKTIAPFVITLTYLAVAAIGVLEVGPVYSPWLLAVLSTLFVWSYVAIVGGRIAFSVSVVFFVTLLFPLAVLAAYVWPTYQSWAALIGSFISLSHEHGQLWGLEILAPLVAALTTAAFIRRQRSNKALNPDARQQPRAG